MKLTKEQQKSLALKYEQHPNGYPSYFAFRRSVRQGYGCIMVRWCGMWLGIETNGYCHT